MFRKKDEPQPEIEAPVRRDETAYEDNWYRSLKALSEQRTLPEDEEGDADAELDPAEASEMADGGAEDAVDRLRSVPDLGEQDASEHDPQPGSASG